LTPKADCSGDKQRMGRISKMGDRYLRRLLVNGMTSQLQAVRRKPEAHPWVTRLCWQASPTSWLPSPWPPKPRGSLGRHDPRRGLPRASSHNRGDRMTV
ncbi:MAG: transposase, partial [Alphaproteobacteria bacterium]